MAWLGYTVTYFSKEVSEEVKWIKYNDWMDVNGFWLPSAITWYNYEDGRPTELRNRVEFVNVRIGKEPFSENIFIKP